MVLLKEASTLWDLENCAVSRKHAINIIEKIKGVLELAGLCVDKKIIAVAGYPKVIGKTFRKVLSEHKDVDLQFILKPEEFIARGRKAPPQIVDQRIYQHLESLRDSWNEYNIDQDNHERPPESLVLLGGDQGYLPLLTELIEFVDIYIIFTLQTTTRPLLNISKKCGILVRIFQDQFTWMAPDEVKDDEIGSGNLEPPNLEPPSPENSDGEEKDPPGDGFEDKSGEDSGGAPGRGKEEDPFGEDSGGAPGRGKEEDPPGPQGGGVKFTQEMSQHVSPHVDTYNHKDESPWFCLLCEYSSSSHSHLMDHIKDHLKGPDHDSVEIASKSKCLVIGNEMSQHVSPQLEASGYTLIRAYPGDANSCKEWLWGNLIKENPEETNSQIVGDKCDDTDEPLYYCKWCKFPTSNYQSFANHLRDVEHANMEQFVESSSRFDISRRMKRHKEIRDREIRNKEIRRAYANQNEEHSVERIESSHQTEKKREKGTEPLSWTQKAALIEISQHVSALVHTYNHKDDDTYEANHPPILYPYKRRGKTHLSQKPPKKRLLLA